MARPPTTVISKLPRLARCADIVALFSRIVRVTREKGSGEMPELDPTEHAHVALALGRLRVAIDATFEQLDRSIMSVTLSRDAPTDQRVLRAMVAPDAAFEEALMDLAKELRPAVGSGAGCGKSYCR
jgi:hypothetical protein